MTHGGQEQRLSASLAGWCAAQRPDNLGSSCIHRENSLHNSGAYTAEQVCPTTPTLSWSSVHVSRVDDRTKLRCTPRLRCTPAHDRQMNTPYGTDAHVGFLAGQSKQTCRESVFEISRRLIRLHKYRAV